MAAGVWNTVRRNHETTKITREEMQNLDSLISPLKEKVRRIEQDCVSALDLDRRLEYLRWCPDQ